MLNLDLKRHRDAEGIDGVSPLERVIIGGWNEESPVDCQVISNELKLLGSLPLNDFLDADHVNNEAQDYRDYLKRSLETAPARIVGQLMLSELIDTLYVN